MKNKIGVGIITHNREDFFKKVLDSIPDGIDIYVANTGNPYDEKVYGSKVKELHQFPRKTCVGWGKNQVMRMMVQDECEHLFTMEDDVYVIDENVYENYINAAFKSGIFHFNFGFSQRENFDPNTGQRAIRATVDYGDDIKIILTPNVLGAFTYYLKGIIKHIGYHDERFDANHMDHPDLTYRAIKAGLHPPFWWFADIDKSWEMIGNLSNMADDSLVRNDQTFREDIGRAFAWFQHKHGYTPVQVPQTSQDEMYRILGEIKKNYARPRQV